MLSSVTLVGVGTAANNIAINTNVAAILNVPIGRYKVWGHVRHTLADGLKLNGLTGLGTIIIPSGANLAANFGPFTIDVLTVQNAFLSLALATGAADTASAILCMENIVKP